MIWKRVKGFENYIVSEMGLVVNTDTGRYLKPYLQRSGHLTVNLCRDGEDRRMYVNRIVAEQFIPNPHGYRFVLHKDGDRSNNDYRNLNWSRNKGVDYTYMKTIKRPAAKGCVVDGIVFESVSSAAKHFGLHRPNLSNALRDGLTTFKGHRIGYEKEDL